MPTRRQTPPSAEPWAEKETYRRPHKRWGQNFLTNRAVLQHILEAAELTPNDDVIEVGPGRGMLTRDLVAHAGRVLAVEVDYALVFDLKRDLAGHENIAIVQGDILAYTPEQLLPLFPNAEQRPPQSYSVVANLPYNIAAPTLRLFLETPRQPKRLVVMVQYEVGQNIVAAPGEMSLLSVAVQYFGQPRLVAKVLPSSFTPSPKVDSAIIRIDTYSTPPVEVPSTEALFSTVRAGFTAPRKQIRNGFAQGLGIATAEAQALLEQALIDPSRRAQTLTLEEWALLTRIRHEGAAA